MANQYLAIVEETTRGTTPGTGYLFPPITGKIEPEPEFKDETRDEYRGQDTRLGDLTVVRKSTSWKFSLEAFFYPVKDLMIALKHCIGYAGARTVVDTSAYKGIMYPPAAFPYGNGGALNGKAIGLVPNTDLDGVTKSQVFGGGRPKGFKIEIKRPDDVKVSIDFIGGPWVGSPGQTAVAGASFTTIKPYNSADVTCYAGSGITRTGTAPDFTDIQPGAMNAFKPDDITITFDAGFEDEDIVDGNRGPAKSTVKNQVKVTLEFTIDYTDPGSGFRSYQEWLNLHTGPRSQSFLFKFLGPDLAGAASQYHQAMLDLPNMRMIGSPPDRDNNGKTPKMKFKYESLYDSTAKYPIGLFTWDKATTY